MKRYIICITIMLVLAASLFAQPKVAVLDAVVDKKIDQAVVVAVTEKVIERLVLSRRFIVLDRTNVDQVLKEREFQLSGLVSDAEITQAGKYLGADYVVAIRVQLITDTYFITCKMIDVKTGVIAGQSSAQGDGKASILLGLAERVGNELAYNAGTGASAQTPAKPAGTTTTAPTVTTQPAATNAPTVTTTPASSKSSPKVSTDKPAATSDNRVGFRIYGAVGKSSQDFSTVGYTNETHEAGAATAYLLWGVLGGLSLIGDFSIMDATDNGGPVLSFYGLGLGFALPLGIFTPWVALQGSVVNAEWGSTSTAGGAGIFDVGCDIRLGFLLIGIMYQYKSISIDFIDTATTEIESSSTSVMLGVRL